MSPKTLYRRASYKKVFQGLFLITKVVLLLLSKRISEKSSFSGQNVMNDLKLKNSKSNVFSNLEGNTVSKSYRFVVKVSLFHSPFCCRSFEFLLHKHLTCDLTTDCIQRNFFIVVYRTRFRYALIF